MLKNYIILGPILGVESNSLYSVCFVLDGLMADDLHLIYHNKKIAPQYCEPMNRYTFCRFSLDIQDLVSNTIEYSLHSISLNSVLNYNFKRITADNLEMAFASCNGTDKKSATNLAESEYQLWEQLDHERPTLLIMGGDQIYSDQIWSKVIDPFRKKHSIEWSIINETLKNELVQLVDQFYENIYISSWGIPSVSKVLATIPSIMSWDDHDIFDGYGSYEDKYQNSDIFKIIYACARKYYILFQLRTLYNTTICGQKNELTQVLQLFNSLFLLPDTRTNRSKQEVTLYAVEDINAKLLLDKKLKVQFENIEHLVFVLPIPIGHKESFTFLQMLSNFINTFYLRFNNLNFIEDDIVDQWDHYDRIVARKNFMNYMYFLATHFPKLKQGIIFSGDLHQGGISNLYYQQNESTLLTFNQIVSSPISNTPTSGFLSKVLELLTVATFRVDDKIIDIKKISDKKWYLHHKNFAIVKESKLCFHYVDQYTYFKSYKNLAKYKNTSAHLPAKWRITINSWLLYIFSPRPLYNLLRLLGK